MQECMREFSGFAVVCLVVALPQVTFTTATASHFLSLRAYSGPYGARMSCSRATEGKFALSGLIVVGKEIIFS